MEQELNEDRILNILNYVDRIKKINLTNKSLKEKRDILIEKLDTYKIFMGRTIKTMNANEKEINSEFEFHESIYFLTPIHKPVLDYKESVKRFFLEKQKETDDLVEFIVNVLIYAETTKEQRVRIDETGMDFEERKAFEEEVLKFKKIYENPNATITEKKISIKTIKNLITTEGQKELFRMLCKNTELLLYVLEGKKDATKRPKKAEN